jgi:hypothetical protein
MRQITCTSRNGAPLINASDREGGSLLFNQDLNNTVWLGKDPNITAPDYVNTIPLSPQSWLALDGEDDIYGVCEPGQTVIINVIDGGQSFFQSGITSGAFRIGPQGLFIYGVQNPHTGTPPVFSATPPNSTSDPFGNPVVQDAVSTYNTFGAVLNVLSMAKGGFFQYRDLGSAAQGGLILSILSVAGVDPVNGSVTRVGMFGQDPFGNAMNVVGASIFLFNALISQTTGGRINIASGSGAVNPFLRVDAPEQGVAGHMQMLLQGTSPDGTQPGQCLIGQVSGAGGLLTPTSQSMLEVQSNISGSSPAAQLVSLAAVDPYLGMRLTSDANNRIRFDGSAPSNRIKLKFGPGGASTQDSAFYNSAAGEFAIDTLKSNQGGSVETDHTLGTLGFANLTINVATFRMLPDGRVFISFKATATGAVTASTQTFSVTLPAAYQPGTTTDLPVILPGGLVNRITVGASGSVSLTLPALVSGNRVTCQCSYDLQ